MRSLYVFGFSNLLLTLGFRLDGGYLPTSPVRVLVVDDFEPFRRVVVSMLRKRPDLQIICEASDGSEAALKAEELQPDLILLDIGLPKLSGIEAARRIRVPLIQNTLCQPGIFCRRSAGSPPLGGDGLRG